MELQPVLHSFAVYFLPVMNASKSSQSSSWIYGSYFNTSSEFSISQIDTEQT